MLNGHKTPIHHQNSDQIVTFIIQDMMEGSQGQYIALEKKMQGDVTAIEKKYHKAKKIIKEYQQRYVLNIAHNKVSSAMQKCTFGTYADSEGPDQTAHPRSLVWAFTVHFQNHWIL